MKLIYELLIVQDLTTYVFSCIYNFVPSYFGVILFMSKIQPKQKCYVDDRWQSKSISVVYYNTVFTLKCTVAHTLVTFLYQYSRNLGEWWLSLMFIVELTELEEWRYEFLKFFWCEKKSGSVNWRHLCYMSKVNNGTVPTKHNLQSN